MRENERSTYHKENNEGFCTGKDGAQVCEAEISIEWVVNCCLMSCSQVRYHRPNVELEKRRCMQIFVIIYSSGTVKAVSIQQRFDLAVGTYCQSRRPECHH